MKAKWTGLLVLCALAAGWATAMQAAPPPPTLWRRQLGTSTVDRGRSAAVDGSGNAFISGFTFGDLGGANAGKDDAFLSKYDSSGTLLWNRQLGTSSWDESYSVAVDGWGNAYISGITLGHLGGVHQGDADAFLAKYDSSGTLLWTRQLGTWSENRSRSVAVDVSGNAFISGYTKANLAGTNLDPNNYDAWLAKYDSSGTLLWKRQLGTAPDDKSYAVAVDASGNALVSGGTCGSLGGPNAGGRDAFLAKYNSSGTLLWTEQLGTSADDVSHSVAVDGSGNAYISGYTNGSLGGASAGSADAFLAKYDSSGTLLWNTQFGTSAEDSSNSVAVDGSGNAFISGSTASGSVPADVFLVKYDSSGTLLWDTQFGTSTTDRSYSVAADSPGNVLISGETWGSLGGTNQGELDAFVLKIAAEQPAPGDASLDGVVDGGDYTIWADHYQQAGDWTEGDLTGNGIVDGADYTIWADNFNSGGGAGVPEPATLSVLALGACLTLLRRYRIGGGRKR